MKRKQRRSILIAAVLLGLLLTVSCSTATTRVVLLPDKDGTTGAIAVFKGKKATVLDSPMATAEVGAWGGVDTRMTSSAQVRSEFGPAMAAQPPEPISFVLYFEEGTTVVMPESRGTLGALFAEVASRQAVEVQVTGHTDTVGQREDNDRLSTLRAETIKQMLIQKGLRASFIRAVGRGERQLLIPTADNVAELKNRRVEVIVR
jgi:outer membrane protein OmpA-like peptidoglycan-associated protein